MDIHIYIYIYMYIHTHTYTYTCDNITPALRAPAAEYRGSSYKLL